jgi:hypothetical protein
VSTFCNGARAFPNEWNAQEGMSLRDYFAAAALQGWAANGQVKVEMKDGGPFGFTAAWCYVLADAMLAEREKTK